MRPLSILKGTSSQVLVEARALQRERHQYGARKPAELKTITIITRRNGETIKRQTYKGV